MKTKKDFLAKKENAYKMTDIELKKIIQNEFERLYEEKQKMENKFNFRDTKTLLKSLPLFKAQVNNLKIKIKELENSAGLVSCNSKNTENVQRTPVYISELEKKETIIEQYKSRIYKLETIINQLNNSMQCISNHKYYDIIPMKYIQEMTTIEIAEKLGIDESTVKRNINLLVSKIKFTLFN